MALDRTKILKHAGTYKTEKVHVPAWADENGDDVVIVRGMTTREFDVHSARAQRSASDKEPKGTLTASLITRCVIAEDGSRVFSDGDIDQINELPAGDVSKLSEAIAELSGLSDEAQEAIEGNSAAAQSGSSDSD